MDFSRRDFIKTASTIAAFTIVPRHVLGGAGNVAPSEKVNIGCIGVGGQGTSDMRQFLRDKNAQVVAVCDVAKNTDCTKVYYKATRGREPARKIVNEFYAKENNNPGYKGCRAYNDYNEMLQGSDIDAVLVATPDHVHAVAAMAAIKKGKHVYCEKPLTYTVAEARALTEAARKYNVVTQMGHQLHATEGLKLLVEMVKSGTIGKIKEIHLWAAAMYGAKVRPTDTPPVPEGMDWDKWIGPAPYRPYNPAYAPFHWRHWIDFGTGNLGDFGCHIMDPAFWAIGLPDKLTVEASSSPVTKESYAVASKLKYRFTPEGYSAPITLNWYDGGIKPFRPAELEEGRDLPKAGGLYVGEKGTILCPHGGGPRLIPETEMKSFKKPQPFIPRGESHYQEFVRACKTGPKPLSNFDYAGPLTEIVLLGNIAIRAKKKLVWDASQMKITNCSEANNLIQREYRPGWSL
jgi:predicted dehydrogenase